jgi:hypothetical protein
LALATEAAEAEDIVDGLMEIDMNDKMEALPL